MNLYSTTCILKETVNTTHFLTYLFIYSPQILGTHLLYVFTSFKKQGPSKPTYSFREFTHSFTWFRLTWLQLNPEARDLWEEDVMSSSTKRMDYEKEVQKKDWKKSIVKNLDKWEWDSLFFFSVVYMCSFCRRTGVISSGLDRISFDQYWDKTVRDWILHFTLLTIKYYNFVVKTYEKVHSSETKDIQFGFSVLNSCEIL